MKCNRCNTKIGKQRWIVDEIIYCSPRCERLSWDERAHKWSTNAHRYGDKRVLREGVAGFVRGTK